MQVAFHVGTYGTDEYKIAECLTANAAVLRPLGVELSPNGLNEPIISEALNALKGGIASAEMEDVIQDALFERDDTRRLVVSRPNLLGPPRMVLEGGGLWSTGARRLRALADIMPTTEVEFFLALKNPATLAPDALARMTRPSAELAASVVPADLRWAPAIRRMLEELGDRRLVVWCNEDTPLIFPEVVRRIAGLGGDTALTGENPVAASLLDDEGRTLLDKLLADHGPSAVSARRGATAALLAERHDPATLQITVDGLGWDQAIVDDLTAAYDADVAEIAALPGIEFIHP